ncbi:MAG TPA: DEAD/DEAH box helicase [Anaerolineae bacterium]|nr:DEAD/DEAH box helicase [Anaerolineae bacterium]
MQILHGHWLLPRQADEMGRFFLWAETGVGEQPTYNRRKRSAQPHPYVMLGEGVRDLLLADEQWSAVGTATARKMVVETRTLWLPSNRFGPLPSPTLVHDWVVDDGEVVLRPWQISGVCLPAEVAWLMLIEPSSTLRVGAGLLYFQRLAHFVLEILAGQKFRPILIPAHGTHEAVYAARWEAVLDNEQDSYRLQQWSLGMPLICQADTADPNEPDPPRAIIDHFLNYMVDTAVRQWAGRQELFLPTATSPEAQWLRALFAPEPTFTGNAAPLNHLYRSYRAWTRALTVAGDKHYRIAFRLEAPAKGGKKKGAWRLHYLLQARDDSSLLVPAEVVWGAGGQILEHLDRRFERPQERLLTGLGYASRFFKPIETSLKKSKPTGIGLTTDEAFLFLRDCVPQLAESGFGLLVPPWWNRPQARLGVRLKLGSQSGGEGGVDSGKLGLKNLVNYQWELAIGDKSISQEEFEALVALKSPLVQVRGEWVQLDSDQIEAAIQFWQKQEEWQGEVTPVEAMRMGLNPLDDQQGLEINEIEIEGWFDDWLRQLQGDDKLRMLPPPDGLEATLRPYQRYGFSWLDFAQRLGLGVILADDMGLGKTIQTLTLIQRQKESREGLSDPILLICPTSVVTNWRLEAEKFTPDLVTMVHQGGDRLRGEGLVAAVADIDILLTSYALVRRDAEVLGEIEWAAVILDEAQNIKNANTKQARAIRRLQTDFRLALTGTPVENRLSELWSIMHFLNPGYLGTQKAFRQQFVLPIEKYGAQEEAQKLRQLIKPFILRRVKTDPTVITDLPEKQELKVYCHLSEEQATLYEAIVQDGLEAIEAEEETGITRKGLVLSMLTQLKQVCNHPAHYLHQGEGYNPLADEGQSGKLARFHQILEEVLAEGDRLLVFSQFTEMGTLLKRYIQTHFGVSTLFLHGGVRPKKRAMMVEQFQEEDGPPVFVLSLKAGGTGLNLTRANHVFHYDRWWNPAVEDQATDRAFRIGQTRNVMVHKFVCLGTLEEQIDKMISDKKALAEAVVGQGEGWLTEMSTADLRQLVRLRR